jgi:hypothetical chaperone protein
MRVGVDFGTTNSSVAHFSETGLQPIELDPGNQNRNVLPSLIYIERDQNTSLGSVAAARYLQQETGRKSIWERRYMGAIEMIVAGAGSSPIRYMHDIYDLVDINANGRLLQSVKTALRDPQYEGTVIFDRYYTIDELIATVLKRMRRRAEEQLGESCREVVLGRPVRFSDDPAVSERAEEILYKAARFAGFKEVSFALEPHAAAHLYHRSSPTREIAFIFDFGGGTLDLTVAEVGGTQPPRVLASRGVLVGGDDLDRRIMESLLHYFGAGTQVQPEVDFPYDMLELLKSWQTMPDLSRPDQIGKIREFQERSNNPQAMRALETLVSENVGFALFKIIEQAKIELSEELLARLDFVYKEIQIHERLLRRNFETLIEQELALVERETQQVLADAGVQPAAVAVVLRTGGSSLVPAFMDLLAGVFGAHKIREMDPLTSVVGGMALMAYEESGRAPGDYLRHYRSPLRGVRASSGREYRRIKLRAFRPAYTDRPYPIMRLPLTLSGLSAIQTADLDYEVAEKRHLRFHLTRPSTVYVAYLSTAEHLPVWLRRFTPEPMHVEVEHPGGRMFFPVYSRTYDKGTVVLGGNQAPGTKGPAFMNYLVAAKPL